MRFDDVLEEIGGFGYFQKFVFVLSCIPGLFAGFFMLNPVFLLAVPNHRCEIPGYDNDTYKIQNIEHEDLINKYIPTSDDYDYNRCYVDLVCDKEIWVANAEMIFYFGMLVGSLASGIIADVYGRKPVVYGAVVLMTASSIVLSWAHEYWLFCVIEFILGAAVVAAFMPAYIITIEITCAKKRIWPGVISDFPYVAGLLVLSGVAYWLKDWFKIQLYTSLPCVILLSYWWLIPESPRWLLTKGRVKEAEVAIRRMARWNKTKVPDKMFDEKTLEEDIDKDSSFVKLFNTRKQLFRTCVIFFNWAVVAMTYFGLALNSENLNGNLYLNFAISGLVEIPAYIIVILLVDRVGRRRLYCVMMILGGLCCASTIFSIEYEPKGSDVLTISLSMTGRLCVTSAYCVAYIHSAELFPTVVRTAGLGAASLFARLGTMVAPYIVVWGESYDGTMREALPLLIFGIVSLISGFMSLMLPETLNTHLPDTVQDGDRFGRSGAFYFVRSIRRHQDEVERSYNNGLYESERELLLSSDRTTLKS
ncbi:hypothetical protein ACF0H5_007963 [Mactra antiquata]